MNKAFEGDTYIKDELIKLRDKFGITNCVETGSQYGSTTLELYVIFNNVLTIEADENYYNEAIKRFKNLNIQHYLGRSEGLRYLNIPDNILYYLDAHGGEIGGCPLKNELEIIAQKGNKNVCIAIHDFKVPGKDFGFDTYDYELCYEEIEPYLKMIYKDGFDYHYNIEADGARQGIIYIYPKIKNMKKQSLTEIFSEIGHFGNDEGHNDKNSTHTYTETYDRLFEQFRNGCTFMEIGLALGKSIELFDRYFENSKIVGVDISIVFQRGEYRNNVRLIEADATKPIILEHLKEFTFDIILDDGSHMENDQVASFELLKHKMNKGGIYIIEDILALDQNRQRFEALHDNCEIIDKRNTGRFDNVLIIYRF